MAHRRRESHLKHSNIIKDLLIVSAIAVTMFVVSSHFDILEKFKDFSHSYEHLQLDEAIIVFATLAFMMMIFSVRRVYELQQDIVERRRSEEALRRHEEWFKSLIENASDLITVLDRHGIIRYGSSAVANVLGYHPKALIGENAFTLVHPDEGPAVLQSFTRILEAPGLTHAVEFRLRHQDGSWHYFESIGSHFRPEADEAAVIVNARCIDERKRIEQSLAECSRRLESIRSISVEITRELEIATLLTLIHERLGELLGRSSVVFLWDDDQHWLVPTVWHGLPAWVQQAPLRLAKALRGASPSGGKG